MLGKSQLIETIASVNRGLTATPDDRQTILAQITQLEERNPTPRPTTALSLLEGNWRLLYTTSQELLGIDRFPGVQLGAIYQCIDPEQNRIINLAETETLSFIEGLISVVAKFEVISNQRLSVGFERGIFGLKSFLSYQSPAQWLPELNKRSLTKQRFLGLDFDIPPQNRQGWIDITYLDTNLRINRGNEGSIFVLVKD